MIKVRIDPRCETQEYGKLIDWCVELDIAGTTWNILNIYCFVFENDEDAVAFKLRFDL